VWDLSTEEAGVVERVYCGLRDGVSTRYIYWEFMERVSKINGVGTKKKVKEDGRERWREGKQREKEYGRRRNNRGTRKEGERNGGSKGEEGVRTKEEGMDGPRCCTPHTRRPQE
jgi:hypothetical protein